MNYDQLSVSKCISLNSTFLKIECGQNGTVGFIRLEDIINQYHRREPFNPVEDDMSNGVLFRARMCNAALSPNLAREKSESVTIRETYLKSKGFL
jgi:hypothetical protein